jgi:Domain of unknown function (DUF4157)
MAYASAHRIRTTAFDRSAPTSMATTPRPRAAGLSNQALLRRLQPKLTIGAVDDPLEREADAVADQVMRMPDPALSVSPSPPKVSRKCAACEEEAKNTVQTKREDAGSGAGETPEVVNEVLRSPGEPLNRSTRQFFEPRFDADFSGVRVHRDAHAARSARDVQAKAYAVGNRIVFSDSAYAPGTGPGLHLLAHELAHVVQQGASPSLRRSQAASETLASDTNGLAPLGSLSAASTRLQRANCADYNESSKALCEQQKCVTRDGADGMCRKTGLHVCACFPSRMWRELLPSWVLALLSAAAIALIAACFATGACEFGAVVGGLGAAAAAAVIAVLKAAGIRDTGGVASADATQGASAADNPQQAPA